MTTSDHSSEPWPDAPGPIRYRHGLATLTRVGIGDLIRVLETAHIDYYEPKRSLLMSGLPRELVADLPIYSKPHEQLQSDITLLSRMSAADERERPLLLWLSNVESSVKFHVDAGRYVRRLIRGLRQRESVESSLIRRSRDIAQGLARFGGETDGVIRVCAGFSSLGIPRTNAHADPAVADALQAERRAFDDVLKTGKVTLRAILDPGKWRDEQKQTRESISRRERWLAYCSELQRVIEASQGWGEVTLEDRKAFMGWKLEVIYSNDLADHNLLILGQRACFRGLRLRRGGGYVRTRYTTDPGRVAEEALDFDLLFDSALDRIGARFEADTRAEALDFARRDMVQRLEDQAWRVRKWLDGDPQA